MNKETVFSEVTNDLYNIFYNKGFYYIDHNYINIFRWLWNDCNIYPRIETFPFDKDKRCKITLTDMSHQLHTLYGAGYDDAVIMTVKHISDHIDLYFKKNA